MTLRTALLVLMVCASPLWGAELHTLKGEVIQGEIKTITDKEIAIAQGAALVCKPLPEVLEVSFPTTSSTRVEIPDDFIGVELTDGTRLYCKTFQARGKQARMQTLADQEVQVPLTAVANVLEQAGKEKDRLEWKKRLTHKYRRDVVCVRNKAGVVNPLEGTLGEGDEEGTHIDFQLAGGKQASIPLANVYGLIFQREVDPNAPSVVCRVHDRFQNAVFASSVRLTDKGIHVVTPAGAQLDYAPALLRQLDYSQGKVSFLSRLEPVRVTETSNLEHIEHYRRDLNLDGKPLRVNGQVYPMGLALHAHTELEYDVGGDYRELKAVAGIDDSFPAVDGPVVLEIQGDGKTLFKATYQRQMKGSEQEKKKLTNLSLNVKDVQRIRIIVSSGDEFDVGKQLDLADARVSK
jgi:hypothetical protein